MSKIKVHGTERHVKVFGKDGRELDWDPHALIRIEGEHAIVADGKVPLSSKVSSFHGSGIARAAGWSLPGWDPDDVAVLLGTILYKLRMLGRLLEDEYCRLERDAVRGRDPEACRRALALGLERRFWIRVLKQGRTRMSVSDPAAFDPRRDGLVWCAPLCFPEGMGKAEADAELKKALERIDEMERNRERYSLFIARVRETGEGRWMVDEGFVRVQEGVRCFRDMASDLGRYRKEKHIMDELDRYRRQGVWHFDILFNHDLWEQERARILKQGTMPCVSRPKSRHDKGV